MFALLLLLIPATSFSIESDTIKGRPYFFVWRDYDVYCEKYASYVPPVLENCYIPKEKIHIKKIANAKNVIKI